MYQLQLPNSPTALRLGADFLNVLAEHAERIRDECGHERITAPFPFDVNLDFAKSTEQLAALTERTLEVATPAPEPQPEQPAPGELGSPEMDRALDEDQAKLEALGAFDPAPELVYHEDRAGGFTLEAMRKAGWSDQQLVDAGYAEWVVPAPKPVVPSASAPTPPAAPAAPVPPAQATELDKDGFPWDERIHSSSRAKVQDGTWKRKRGVDESLVAQVEAELAVLVGKADSVPSATAPVSAPASPSAPAPAASGPTDFASLNQWLVAAVKANRISPNDVSLAVMGCGVEGVNMLPHLQGRPDLIPQVVAKLAAKVGGA